MICFCGCSSARRPALWCAPRADRSSASTTTPAIPAAAGIRASGASGRCCGRSATISASSRSSSTAVRRSTSSPHLHRRQRRRHHGSGGLLGMLAPAHQVELALGASGRRTGLPLPPLVDGPQRRMAARQRAAHSLQYDVDTAAGPDRRGHLRSGPDGHHLHRRRRRRLHVSSFAGFYLHAFPIPILRGAMLTLGASAPIFGLLGALVHYGRRGGSSLYSQRGAGLCRHARLLRASSSGRRQRRALRRFRRRLPRQRIGSIR